MTLRQKTYKDKSGKTHTSKTWSIRFTDHLKCRRDLLAYTNKQQSASLDRMLNKLVMAVLDGGGLSLELREWAQDLDDQTRDRLIEWGLLPTAMTSVVVPLVDHVDAYCCTLLNQDKTKSHVDLIRSRLPLMFKACGFVYWRDIETPAVEAWLADKRRAGKMKTTTSNHYATMLRAFCQWMVAQGRAPAATTKAANVTVTDAVAFGAFTVEQVQALLAYCMNATDTWGINQRRANPSDSNPPTQSLDGPDRAFVYRLAVETAMRAGTIRSVTVGQVKLNTHADGRGEIRTAVGHQKNRKAFTVRLRPSMAVEVARHIKGKAPTDLLVCLPVYAAAMLAEDLRGAGLPDVDEDGLPLRFHSFRVTTATWLGHEGATSQEIASVTGHLTRAMVDHYTHASKRMAEKAVELLPDLDQQVPQSEEIGTALSQGVPLIDMQSTPNGAYSTDKGRWGGGAVERAGLENR